MEKDLEKLRIENARLIKLLEYHGIDWQLPEKVAVEPEPIRFVEAEPSFISTAEKLNIFRKLFRGRTDIYPVRWESKTTGKSGYSPACENEWVPIVCEKPRIKCADCTKRKLAPLTDAVVYDHLAGKQTIGVFPLLNDDTCYFLAVDFDEQDWKEDARAFMQSCMELNIPAALEISRSGNGAHVWIFFADRVTARDARRLGTAIISHTCTRTRQLKLNSYDRLFPNQDTLPKGGFGNLIALPLQKKPRKHGCSIFVDKNFNPHPDQWSFLFSIKPMSPYDIEPVIFTATGNAHPLDVNFIDEEDQKEPWKRDKNRSNKIPGVMPKVLKITLANLIYVEKQDLPQSLANRIIRLAAFQNPEFYKAQAMRLPVWDKPRVIGCAENYPLHIALPRGCLDVLKKLLSENDICYEIQDERYAGELINIKFSGVLRTDQETAVSEILQYEVGVLCAPTAFGKTVTAAAAIARRGINTLILVHRTELLKQWQERLQSFLAVEKGAIGVIGSGKNKPTGKIDIAVMQSISRQGEINPIVENYGQVIVDECHHIGAFSFDAILKKVKAKYVLGLTATPIRRDGQQPIIFMQCGPIRHTATKSESAPNDLEVIPISSHSRIELSQDASIQDVFRHLANDAARTEKIVAETLCAFNIGRKVLVLTERTEHLDIISGALSERVPTYFILHGRMSKKQRATTISELEALPPDEPRILLATGKLVGEGFDHPPLDTMVLAMPVSWKGTLQQYAGRLHREHANKTDVKIIDVVDSGHPSLLRMWEKRLRGYRAMGYRIVQVNSLQVV